MTGFKMVFLDTSPFIYYLQESDLYYSNMERFWRDYRCIAAG